MGSGTECPPGRSRRGDGRPSGAAVDGQADGRASHRRLGLGATQDLPWPPTIEQARALTRFAPSALAAFVRLRAGQVPIDPDPSLDIVEGFLYQSNGSRPDAGTARALDAYFIVGAEHSFNASTFTARVVASTRSDIASAVAAPSGR